MSKEIKITQKHEDCHYETIIWRNGYPIHCGYGFSQSKADTKCLSAFLNKEYLI